MDPLAREVVDRLLGELSRRIRVEAAYLFGSRARGDYLKTSDVDLVVVSEDFRGMKFTERMDLVERVAWEMGLRPHVQVIPLTRGELRERVKGSFALMDASKYWVKVR